jgi:hypothetical protein
MKKGNDDIGCPAQERANILDNPMRVLGFIDGQKNSHSDLHGKRHREQRSLHYPPPDQPIPEAAKASPHSIAGG